MIAAVDFRPVIVDGQRVRINVTSFNRLESVNARNIVRRNYRWMRRGGMSATMARLVIDSTLRAQRDDALSKRCEVPA